ncbi:hypothetical protein L1887_54023 [Cichorium endivia]|nr:hypothetical protein L1887_54023 [Cichorium endivia]
MPPKPSANPSTTNKADATQQPEPDEPVPSYETALREGAGGGIAAGPSHSPAPPVHPAYGCSPYTPHGTARIVIVPAPHFHSQTDALLPPPASMNAPLGPRAKPRFFLALLHAIIIYILINLLVDLTVTRNWPQSHARCTYWMSFSSLRSQRQEGSDSSISGLGKGMAGMDCYYLLDNVRQSRTTVPAEKLVPARGDTHLGIHTVQSARQDVLVRDGTPKHLGILHHFHARVRKHSGSRRTKRSPGHHGHRQDGGEDQRSSNHRQGIWDEREVGVMAKQGERRADRPLFIIEMSATRRFATQRCLDSPCTFRRDTPGRQVRVEPRSSPEATYRLNCRSAPMSIACDGMLTVVDARRCVNYSHSPGRESMGHCSMLDVAGLYSANRVKFGVRWSIMLDFEMLRVTSNLLSR